MPITKAHLTLLSGCEFWARNTLPLVLSSRQASAVALRMNGNRLHELDRFMSVLLDEIVALDRRRRGSSSGRKRLSSTSRKLFAVEALLGIESFAHARLRAIGRMSSSLRSGAACTRASHRSRDARLAMGMEDAPDGHASLNPLQLSHHSILAICQFYSALGDRLLSAVLVWQSLPHRTPDGADRTP